MGAVRPGRGVHAESVLHHGRHPSLPPHLWWGDSELPRRPSTPLCLPPLALSPLLARHGRDHAAADISPPWPVIDPAEHDMTPISPSYLSHACSPWEKPTEPCSRCPPPWTPKASLQPPWPSHLSRSWGEPWPSLVAYGVPDARALLLAVQPLESHRRRHGRRRAVCSRGQQATVHLRSWFGHLRMRAGTMVPVLPFPVAGTGIIS
jgi:hypothetical protein